MFGLEIENSVVLEQKKILEQALSTNPRTQKALQKLIRRVIMDAREKVSRGARSAMDSDPRHTAEAVRTSVYKRILGANVNIYNSRKAHGKNNYVPTRKGSTGRGGNRRSVSPITNRMMSYAPLDRGFVLRWINSGVKGRNISFQENPRRKVDKWNKHPNTGYRGSIAPRNFFEGSGKRALAVAADELSGLIDKELEVILNKTK